MRTVILKNIGTEGPGALGEYLRMRGLAYDLVEPEGVPSISLEGYDALVILGGPMAVYEMDSHPQVRASLALAAEAIERNMRVLGICLGAQIIASALGADVYKGEAGQEIGWMSVRLTEEGASDPFMATLARDGEGCVIVFQWHGDTFDLPADAVLLAGSEAYPNQAFRYGENIYALQFHIEATREMVSEWLRDEGRPRASAIGDGDYTRYLEGAERAFAGFFG